MNNPRNINQIVQSASATQKARLPAIPAINQTSLQDVVTAMKERMEVREGERGNPFERTVTLRDLDDLGLIRTGPGRVAQQNLAGVVCQTVSGGYIFVSLPDLVNTIKSMLSQ